MRVAALVAADRCSTSATRTCSDASVCWRRPGVWVVGASVDCAESSGVAVGAPWSELPPTPALGTVKDLKVEGAFSPTAAGECAARLTGRGPEDPVSPCTSAAATASPSAAGIATRMSRRDGRGAKLRRGAGAAAITRARSASGARSVAPRSSPSNAARRVSSSVRGAAPPSSASSRSSPIASVADILNPLLQVFQRTAQACRARGLADSKHACGARAVELEEDAERDDLALGRRQLTHRLLQRPGQSVHQLGRLREVARVRLLAAAPARLRAEPVDGDRPRDATEPGAGRAAPRIKAPPGAERLLERLRREVFRRRAIAGQEDEVAVDGVELLGRDVCEARPGAESRTRVERGRNRVHALTYGAAGADRHILSVERCARCCASPHGRAVRARRGPPT